jgi:hypothetical protein
VCIFIHMRISLKALFLEANSGLAAIPQVREIADQCYATIQSFFNRNKNKHFTGKYYSGHTKLFDKLMKTTDMNGNTLSYHLRVVGYNSTEDGNQLRAQYNRTAGKSQKLKEITIFLRNNHPKGAAWKQEIGDFFAGGEEIVKQDIYHEAGHLVKDLFGYDYGKSKRRDKLISKYTNNKDMAAYFSSGDEMETNMLSVLSEIQSFIEQLPTKNFTLASVLKMLPTSSTYKEIRNAFIDPATKQFKNHTYQRQFKTLLTKLVHWWETTYPDKSVK